MSNDLTVHPRTALSDYAARPGLRLVSFKPLRKGSLVGFATVELPIGLKIVDCPVCFNNGKAWATLPGKPQTDRDGQPIRNERGKLAYIRILDWRDGRLRDAFSERRRVGARTASRRLHRHGTGRIAMKPTNFGRLYPDLGWHLVTIPKGSSSGNMTRR